MNEIARRSLLLDYYGGLLTDKQREIYDFYYQQDLSLGEIAELQGVSRNAVYDLLNRTNEKLEHYDAILGLIAADLKADQAKENLLKRLQHWQGTVTDYLSEADQSKLAVLLADLKQL